MNDSTEDHQPTVKSGDIATGNPDSSETDRIARPYQAVGATGSAAACQSPAVDSTANDFGINTVSTAENGDGAMEGTAAADGGRGTDCEAAPASLGAAEAAAAVAGVFCSHSVAANECDAGHENSAAADRPGAAGLATADTTDRDASSAGNPASRATQRHTPSVVGREKSTAATASMELPSTINTPKPLPLVDVLLVDEAGDKGNRRDPKEIPEGPKGLGKTPLKEQSLEGGLDSCGGRITMGGTDGHALGTTAATDSRTTLAAALPGTLYYGVSVAGEILQPTDTPSPGDLAITSGGKEVSSMTSKALEVKEGRRPKKADLEHGLEQEEANERMSISGRAAAGRAKPDGSVGRQGPSDIHMEAEADASSVGLDPDSLVKEATSSAEEAAAAVEEAVYGPQLKGDEERRDPVNRTHTEARRDYLGGAVQEAPEARSSDGAVTRLAFEHAAPEAGPLDVASGGWGVGCDSGSGSGKVAAPGSLNQASEMERRSHGGVRGLDTDDGANQLGAIAGFSLGGEMGKTGSAGAELAQGPEEAAAEPERELLQGGCSDSLAGDAEASTQNAKLLAPSVTDMAAELILIDGSAGSGSMPVEGRDEQGEAEPEAQVGDETKAKLCGARLSDQPAGKSGAEPSSDSAPAEDAEEGAPMAQMELGAPVPAPEMATTAADSESTQSRRAAVESPPTSLSTITASRKAGTVQAAAASSTGALPQVPRAPRSSKPSSTASAQSTAGRMAAAGPQAVALQAGPPDAGKSAPVRAASVGGAGTAPEGPRRASKVARSRLADANPLPHNAHEHAKAKSYAQLYTARSIDVPSGGGTGVQSTVAAEAAGQSASQLFLPIELVAKSSDNEDGLQSSLASEDVPPSSGGGGRVSKVGGNGVLAPYRRVSRADPDDELGLIVQVEAEAVQLGLEIYARADSSRADHGGSSRDVGHEGSRVGGDEDGEESLEVIMAMGRRPSEIAELLLGGMTAAVSAGTAADRDVADGKAARRCQKREEKEQKRALRREQKRQRRQRKRALMGLDPYGNDGDSGDESSSSSSSSSTSTSSASESSSSSNSKNNECLGGNSGHDGQIRAADSRAMLLFSAASTEPNDIGLFRGGGNATLTDPEALDDDLAGEGRILTSAGAAAALGLGLLFAPREDTTELLSRCATDRDPSGCVPSYFLNTPLEPRASDGMTFQPRPGSVYAPSLAPTIASDGSSTLTRTEEASEPLSQPVPVLPPSGGGTGGVSRGGGGGGHGDSVRSAEMDYDDHDQFLAMRDERSRKIAEQLAALQEESRLLQQQSMLLQERTREIGRSVGLPTPPQFTNASTSVSLLKQPRAHPQAAEQAGPVAGPSPREKTEGAPSGDSGTMAIGSLPPLRHRVPSPAVTAAKIPSGSTDGPAPPLPESQPGSDTNPLGASPPQKQAPINWALPNRNAKLTMNKRPAVTTATAPPQPQAFPSPPKGAHRLQALAHAEMQRTGSSSSLIDSLLPRWAEQVESPVMTPENRPANPHSLSPLPGCPPAAAIDIVGDDLSPASPPQPLMLHVPKGRPGGVPFPPAGAATGGRGQGHVKSRLGAAVATTAPGTHHRGHAGPLTKAGIPIKLAQPQPGQPQQPLGMPPLVTPIAVLQPPYDPVLATAQQRGTPADWVQAGVPPGLPQAPLPPPSVPGLPLAPGTVVGPGAVFPPFPGMIQPRATMSTTGGPGTVPAPAPAAKRGMGSKGPMRPIKPMKGPAGLAGTGNGFPAGGNSNNKGGMDGSCYGGSGGAMETAPPPWVQIPGQGIAMGAAIGTVPMMMQSPLGFLEQMTPLGPAGLMGAWLPLPQASSADSSSQNGAGVAAAAKKDLNPGQVRHHVPSKRPDDHALAVPEEQAYCPIPVGLPGSLQFPGAPNSMMLPWMHDKINGSDGIVDSASTVQHQTAQNALPPVRLQAGKGKMSRSAPPGSYSAAAKNTYVPTDGFFPGFEGLGFGLPMAAWPAPAITAHSLYSMPGPDFIFNAGDVLASPGTEASAMVQRANMVQQQQADRYRELESNLMTKLDKQANPGGKARERRRNSHDGRPVFRLF
ncbi:hypothetical protein Vretimale_1304 [Volvox reticuliferus]|uniref:Uncharacterized protein n=1 Tax=Volvox reticuliferus TaxID=1737510 RepID=A0A8J4CKQ1_9CHLO|nr:hypothetical protein Vretifemale_10670 [Volvox reticuliferus]GIL95220.1 hypothetical protein Vretimale_1304 [Volvox reticuliferus]